MRASTASWFPGFETRRVKVEPGMHIAALVGGHGPPLLLLHGHPQTRTIWHRVAPVLAHDRGARVALQVEGGTLPCGHCIAEEAPAALLERAVPFLRRSPPA